MAGNRVFITGNAGEDKDAALFAKLGLTPTAAEQRAVGAGHDFLVFAIGYGASRALGPLLRSSIGR